MTEWQLQIELTKRWVRQGHVELAGERFVLAGWEVMERDWRINDHQHPPWSPSIDFLLLDAEGGLVALELKDRVRGVQGAWELLCQVSHRAAALAASYTPARLTAAHLHCMTGRDRRIGLTDAATSLSATVSSVFGRPERPSPESMPPLRRFVMAQRYNRSWADCSAAFAGFDVVTSGQLDVYVARPRPPREIRRWAGVPRAMRDAVRARGPIVAVGTDGRVVGQLSG